MSGSGRWMPTGTPLQRASHSSSSGPAARRCAAFDDVVETSQVRIDDRHGVLVFQLADGSFEWAFHSTPDDTVEDQGTGACH